MKSFLVLATLMLISMVHCIPHPPGPLPEEMKKNFDECRTELGMTIEEERELHRKRDFKNEKMRCMPACLMKKDGVLQEGNKINMDVLIEKAQRFRAVTDDAKKTFQDCYEKAKDKTEECEFARNFMHCTHKAMGPSPPGPMSAEKPEA